MNNEKNPVWYNTDGSKKSGVRVAAETTGVILGATAMGAFPPLGLAVLGVWGLTKILRKKSGTPPPDDQK